MRERQNKGMKRMNSLPLSTARSPQRQPLRNTGALKLVLRPFSALQKKVEFGDNSLPKYFEHNPNIRSNLQISLLSGNITNTKKGLKIFQQLGEICFRKRLRQSENYSVAKFFSPESLFATRSYTILLSRERVNIGTKRMNRLSLSPVGTSYATLEGKTLLTSPA